MQCDETKNANSGLLFEFTSNHLNAIKTLLRTRQQQAFSEGSTIWYTEFMSAAQA